MTQPAVIQATFCGFRTIGGRKQLQLAFEVPVEQSEHVLKTLGSPSAIDPPWVAIALLDKNVLQGEKAPVPTKEKRNWNDLPPATQAGIRCGEPAFWKFLTEHEGYAIDTQEKAENAVRSFCGVHSRADFKVFPEAVEMWNRLSNSYDAWMRAV